MAIYVANSCSNAARSEGQHTPLRIPNTVLPLYRGSKGKHGFHPQHHRMSTADCGGPISLEVRVDVGGPDISEGFTTAVCNGGDATVFGTNDSRGDRGHFVQNHSSQRIDLTWTRQI